MTAPRTAPLTQGQAWAALATHCETVRKLHLRQLFADDPHRGERLRAEAAGLYFDYSTNRINDETLRLLFRLAVRGQVAGQPLSRAVLAGEVS